MSETSELWAKLKPALVRSLGREGAAEWMRHAAATMTAEAKRDSLELPVNEPFHMERREIGR